MAPYFNPCIPISGRRLLRLLATLLLLVGLGACRQKKDSQPVAPAPVAAADAASRGTADDTLEGDLKVCIRDNGQEMDEEADKADEETEAEVQLKAKEKTKGNGKAKKGGDSEDCINKDEPLDPNGSAPPPAGGTGGTGTASLAAGQQIYAANCQSCHGALPGAKQGSTANEILAASGIGPHKSISPWPAGAASALSASLAAESLALALR